MLTRNSLRQACTGEPGGTRLKPGAGAAAAAVVVVVAGGRGRGLRGLGGPGALPVGVFTNLQRSFATLRGVRVRRGRRRRRQRRSRPRVVRRGRRLGRGHVGRGGGPGDRGPGAAALVSPWRGFAPLGGRVALRVDDEGRRGDGQVGHHRGCRRPGEILGQVGKVAPF